MKTTKPIIWAFGALTLVISGGVVSAQAAASRHCTTEECACEEALKQNTIEAFEAFLKKYPDSPGHGQSACAALAVPDDGQGVSSQGGQGGVESLSDEDHSTGG